jgi:hypothetical protein
MRIFFRALLAACAIVATTSYASACRADAAHNNKYHGNPTCSQCTCNH